MNNSLCFSTRRSRSIKFYALILTYNAQRDWNRNDRSGSRSRSFTTWRPLITPDAVHIVYTHIYIYIYMLALREFRILEFKRESVSSFASSCFFGPDVCVYIEGSASVSREASSALVSFVVETTREREFADGPASRSSQQQQQAALLCS